MSTLHRDCNELRLNLENSVMPTERNKKAKAARVATEVPENSTVCYSFVNIPTKDPVLILITLATVVGSCCLLSGLILLCMVSQTLQDRTSESILLMGIGLFISAMACITWQLTSSRRFSELMAEHKEESV